MSEVTFGRRILGQPPEAILALEREHEPAAELRRSDPITTNLVVRSLSGDRVLDLRPGKPFGQLVLPTLGKEERPCLAANFGLEVQQARGAWFLPEEATVGGLANLPYHFARYPRFAVGAAHDGGGKVSFKEGPEALFFWAVLDPLFEALFRPLLLRGPAPSRGDSGAQKAIWDEVEKTFRALGYEIPNELAVFRYGGSWGRLPAGEQLTAKKALLEGLRQQVHGEVAARFRIWRAQDLIAKFYSKAKRKNPLMRQVLTKPLQRVLAGCFGGDWLAFMRYLGESPDPEERISASLPQTRFFVGTSADSPVDRRVATMRDFWQQFEALHSRQAPGMPSLWRLIEDGDAISLAEVSGERSGPEWYHPGSHRKLLTPELLARVEKLWDGAFLPAHPEAVVSAVNPYARMCDAFGATLRFWHGAGLTAWFVSEGPYSRTDMAGLAEYHDRDIREMQDFGCPVDRAVFDELVDAEKRLGEPQPIADPAADDRISEGGITISFSTIVGSRRAGFDRLRDVLARHRRIWADRNLDKYLRALCEAGVRKAAEEYYKLRELKGKPPTLKQFAKFAERATNQWFGGDVSELYAAFGETCPVVPTRVRLLTRPASEVVIRIFAALGGRPTRWEDLAATIRGDDRERQDAAWREHGNRQKLAELSLRYLQLWEALGHQPSLKEFGAGRFEYLAPTLDSDIERAWKSYGLAIEKGVSR